MKRKRKISCMLLTLCMIVSLFPGMTLSAAATESAVPASVTVHGDVTLNSSKPYYVNGEAVESATLGINGCTAHYNAETGVLELNAYRGGAIRSEGDLTIRLTGYCEVESTAGPGIFCLGELTIQGTRTEPNKLDELLVGAKNGTAIYGHEGISITGLSSLVVFAMDESSLLSGTGKDISVTDLDHFFLCNHGGKPAACSSGGNLTIESNLLYVMSSAPYAVSTGSESVAATLTAGIALRVTNDQDGGLAVYPQTSTVTVGGQAVPLSGQQNLAFDSDIRRIAEVSVVENENTKSVTKNEAGYCYTVEYTYTGQVPEFSFTAKDKNKELNDFTYKLVWRDKNSSMLAQAPTDVGVYTVDVYGSNETYTGYVDLELHIVPGPVPDSCAKATAGKITVGNNLITLPEIPGGMQYGVPVECDGNGNDLERNDVSLTSMVISNNQLSIQTERLTGDTYYVKVPVNGVEGKSNYDNYSIMITLTKPGTPLFDLCNGSGPQYDGDTPPSAADAWDENSVDGNDSYTAYTSGYQLEGWYTAPNGWGTKIADANGALESEKSFDNGHTYYAHWVWTRCLVSYDGSAEEWYKAPPVYGELEKPKTVYTTALDFTNRELLKDHASGDGYRWDSASNTLTLSGIRITALDSALGLVLPENSKITFEDDTYQSYYTEAYGSDQQAPYAPTDAASVKTTENSISCSHRESLPVDIYCQGDLTIQNTVPENNFGNYLSAYTGGIRAGGELTIENGVYVTRRILAKSDITLTNIFTDVSSYSQSEKVETMYAVTSETGSISIVNSAVYTDNIMAGKGVSITNTDRCYVYVTDSIRAMGDVTIRDTGVSVAPAEDRWSPDGGIFAENITVTNARLASRSLCAAGALTLSDSTVDIKESGMSTPVLMGEGSTFTNSTVTISGVKDGGIGIMGLNRLTINGGTTTVTAAEGATLHAAIALYGTPEDPGLILNRAVITQPSDGVLSREFRFDDFEGIYKIWTVGKDGTTAVISPVSTSSGNNSPPSPVSSSSAENGSVTVSSKNAVKGSAVTVTVKPDPGYVLDKLTVTDSSGKALVLTDKGSGEYTFTMPAGKVNIQAEFKEEETGTTTPTDTPSYESFGDLTSDAWYHDGVKYVLDNGLMKGVGDGIFSPNATTSRSMVATILWRLAGSPEAGEGSSFSDVTAGTWYCDAVAWAAENGIVNGYGETFDPNGSITREQLAAMLYRFAQSQGKGFSGQWMTNLDYADAESVSDWAYEAMCWMTVNGVINGKDGGILDPQGQATRAEAATMLQRFAENIK